MQVIVPLAGPDFVHLNGSVKALTPFRGGLLLKYILDSRPWSSCVSHYSFILLDSCITRMFAENYLTKWYPNCSTIFLSTSTRGAALSALAGTSVLQNMSESVVIDLADIYYQSSIDLDKIFSSSDQIGAIAFVFKSSNSIYSYLKCDPDDSFIEAAEKKVISNHASAGTYVFKNLSILLSAISHSLHNEKSQSYNNLFYVCPLLNGVHALNKKVILRHVSSVHDVKC